MPSPQIEIQLVSTGGARVRREVEQLRRAASPASASQRQLARDTSLAVRSSQQQAAQLTRTRSTMAAATSSAATLAGAQGRLTATTRAATTAHQAELAALRTRTQAMRALALETTRAAAARVPGAAFLPVGGGGAIVGTAAAIATISALSASTRAASELERDLFRLESIIRATGGTARLSAADIRAFAEELDAQTLADAPAVRQAAAQLLTFRSIAGDTFTRTLRLAQDLSATGFGSLSQSTVQLGKALEDPVRGLSALRRVGVSFTQTETELIKQLTGANKQLEAQQLILRAVEQQVGGAGRGEAAGLSGKVDALGQSWRRLLENIGSTGPWSAALEGITSVISGIDRLIARAGEINVAKVSEGAITAQLGTMREALRQAEAAGAPSAAGLRRRVEELEAERARLAQQGELTRRMGQLGRPPTGPRALIAEPEDLGIGGGGAPIRTPAGVLLRRGEAFGPARPPGWRDVDQEILGGMGSTQRPGPQQVAAAIRSGQIERQNVLLREQTELLSGVGSELSTIAGIAAFEGLDQAGQRLLRTLVELGIQAAVVGSLFAAAGAAGFGPGAGAGLRSSGGLLGSIASIAIPAALSAATGGGAAAAGPAISGLTMTLAQHGAVTSPGQRALIEGAAPHGEAILPLMSTPRGLGVAAAGAGGAPSVQVYNDLTGATVGPGVYAAIRQAIYDALPLIGPSVALQFSSHQGLRRTAGIRGR